MLFAKFGWNLPSGSGEEDEIVKSLRQQQQRRTTDKFWSEKLTWAFCSGELKTNLGVLDTYIIRINILLELTSIEM